MPQALALRNQAQQDFLVVSCRVGCRDFPPPSAFYATFSPFPYPTHTPSLPRSVHSTRVVYTI